MKLKTGVTGNRYSESIRRYFEKYNVETNVIILPESQDYAGALRRGDVHTVVMPLADAPFLEQTDLIIGALTDRSAPGNCLLVRSESYDPTQVLKVRKGGRVAVGSVLFTALLREIRPDLEFVHHESGAGELSGAPDIDAFCVAEDATAKFEEISNFGKVSLNPSEFPPLPGSGVLAILCLRDDMETRHKLKTIHRSEVSVCTNVERSVVKANEKHRNNTGVLCERDGNGYYHASAVFATDEEVRRARISSSTHAGLAGELAKRIFG